ncbi:MAG: hypothetical protein IKT09_06535 [Synergistes sp.]|nr:hypothetical protein [Synergistes sp.]
MNKIRMLLVKLAAGAVSSLKLWVLQMVMEAEDEIPGGTGMEKRAYVVKRLDEIVRLPWYLEPFDGPAFGMLVDLACNKLNLLVGHNWNEAKLTPEQEQKIAAVMDVPAAVAEKAVSDITGASERIESLYEKYGHELD